MHNIKKTAIVIAILISGQDLLAVCCACADKYAAMATNFNILKASAESAKLAQTKETVQLGKMVSRETLELSYEKKRSEIIAQVKQIDSSGFANVVAREQSERIGTTIKQTGAMLEGYSISNEDAKNILDEYK